MNGNMYSHVFIINVCIILPVTNPSRRRGPKILTFTVFSLKLLTYKVFV